jgi:transcriptional regulator with XRE-family HTH domain
LPLMMKGPGTDVDYSANVRAEVARSGSTQGEVAEAIGMTRSQWDRRMANAVDWRAFELHRIADVLGVPIERLTSR